MLIIKKLKPGYMGVFANERILEGTEVFSRWSSVCKILSREEVENLEPEYRSIFKKYCIEIAEFVYAGPQMDECIETEKDYFINHSCVPNVWLVDDDTAVARRDILQGEELTIDYATIIVHPFKETKISICLCGTEECRGSVNETDWWNLRSIYSKHYMSWIQRKIEKKVNNETENM